MTHKFKLGNGDEVEFEYVVNPGGVIHDVAVTHPSQTIRSVADRTAIPIVELARENKEGWRLATKEEIAKYREKNLIGDDEAHSTELAQKKAASEKAAVAAIAAAAAPPKRSKAAAAAPAESDQASNDAQTDEPAEPVKKAARKRAKK